MTKRSLFLVSAGMLVATSLGVAHSSDDPPVTYVLREDSTFQRGCFPPCKCPLSETPVSGTFNLRHISSDPDWFETYEVTNVHWIIEQGNHDVLVTGSGIYRIGGHLQQQHRLALDLVVGDEGVEHYDSGTVPGGADFPFIASDISINGQVCFDSVFEIRAKPTMTLAVGKTLIAWDVLPTAAGYDLVIGDLGLLRATDGDFAAATTGCIADDTVASGAAHDAVPEPGTGVWFAVQAWGETIASTYDSDYPSQVHSRDPGIAAAPQACPPPPAANPMNADP
jgi:hypothetical protein